MVVVVVVVVFLLKGRFFKLTAPHLADNPRIRKLRNLSGLVPGCCKCVLVCDLGAKVHGDRYSRSDIVYCYQSGYIKLPTFE